MDEALKRRLIGALILIVVVFVVSLLLPRPGIVSTDANNQRVTLDLTGNSPEPAPIPATPTPVPPVIAAAPAQTDSSTESAVGNDNTPPPQIEEPPMPAPTVVPPTAPVAEPPKPTITAETQPAPATPPSQAEVTKPESKPALKLEDTLGQKPTIAAAKPVEKTPPKVVAKAPTPAAPKVTPKATPVPELVAKPATAAPASGSSRWFVQLGAFNDISKAHQVLDKLSPKGLKGIISPLDSAKGTLYRTRLGPFASRDKAKEAQERAAQLGYAGGSVIQD